MDAPVQTRELDELISLLTAICETPAPTFAETARGQLIAEILSRAGLTPHIDVLGNVIADVSGGSGPRVLLAAHLDTVFAAETNVQVQEREGRLYAPGLGDNSASLAVLMYYLQELDGAYPRLTIAATVGEEGLGDLRGMRWLMKERAKDFDLVVALDGHLGTIVNAAVGSKRFELRFFARGGHSWGDFPSPSAVHALGDAIYALNRLPLPNNPRSSYNVGQISGGTSINAIAQEAGFNLDLRSLDADVLNKLEHEALNRIKRVARRHSVKLELRQVGDRPTASVANDRLVKAAREALKQLDISPRLAASSTDANASLAAGLPSIAFGLYRGGDAHRLSEWVEPASLLLGYRALLNLLANLSRL